MFAQLLYLVLVLLAIDLAPDFLFNPWPREPALGLVISILLYATVIFLLRMLKKRGRSPKKEALANGLLIAFIVFFYEIAGIQRFFFAIPYFSHTVTAAVALFLYFLGLSLYQSWRIAKFCLPFVLPFIGYVLTLDLFFPLFGDIVFIPLFVIYAFAMLFFLPILFRRLWKCLPLPESPLKNRLDCLCEKVGFNHGGMKVWTVMGKAANAAIIGLLPRFRYVLFTEPLLKAFTEEEVEAILAHEIGHSKHGHLFFYPMLFLGLIGLCSILNPLFTKISPIVFYLCEGTIIVLYFRFFFGFFSRQFEKQADLFVMTAGLSPDSMISALKRLGELQGIDLMRKNWHHGSLQDRISALEKAKENPHYVNQHKRFLYRLLFGYGCIMILSLLTYFIRPLV